MRNYVIVQLIITLGLASLAEAGQSLEFRIAEKVSTLYPGARIELASAPVIEGDAPSGEAAVSSVNESAPGMIRFDLRYASGETRQGNVPFAAYMPAQIALRRVFPGERLSSDTFRTQDVNVTTGLAREYRGLILSPTTDVNTLESRQSVIEGQFLISSAVQRVPDVRRGDAVRIRLVAGDVTLMTSGTVSEPAYVNQVVRVMTLKTKKDLVGKLRSDKSVEVTL